MCRYREYYWTCSHVTTEPEPYLPCHPTDFCSPKETSDPPIKIHKSGPCGAADCAFSASHPSGAAGGGTSWEATRSKSNSNGLGEEGGAGAKFRHTVSMKMKTNAFSKVARSLTNKKKKGEEPSFNGFESYGAGKDGTTAA